LHIARGKHDFTVLFLIKNLFRIKTFLIQLDEYLSVSMILDEYLSVSML
jgi:hypothetical protein